MTQDKACRDCGKTLPVSSFHRESRSPDGFRSSCKACRSAYMTARYAESGDEIRARQLANPRDPIAADAYQREYRVLNRDKLRAKNARWTRENRVRKREYNAEYYAANRARIAETARAWRAANHDAVLAMNREREALKRLARVDKGITVPVLRRRDGDGCAYCGVAMLFGRTSSYLPEKASVDHVIPLVRGGEHSFANVVLACLRCNISKRDRRPDEWSPPARVEGLRYDGSSALDEAAS